MKQMGREVQGVPPTPDADFRSAIDSARLVAANRAAGEFFADRIHAPEAKSPRRYLKARGLCSVLDSERWTIGYAPATWTRLTEHLHNLSFRDDELVQAGLSMRSRRGNLIDRFRDRITIGIHDHDDTLVAFIARAGPLTRKSTPKYLNSPRTLTYNKSEVLFGLSEQRDRLEGGATPVLVEGPLDVLAVDAAAADRFAAVAPCGTALTDTQVAALAAITHDQVIVAFDADQAGIQASVNAYPLLRRSFTHPVAADLPSGSDPAELMATEDGPTRLRRSLLEPRVLEDVLVDGALEPWKGHIDNAEAKVAALRSAAARIGSLLPMDVARQADRLAKELDMGHDTIARELTVAVLRNLRSESAARHPRRSLELLSRNRGFR